MLRLISRLISHHRGDPLIGNLDMRSAQTVSIPKLAHYPPRDGPFRRIPTTIFPTLLGAVPESERGRICAQHNKLVKFGDFGETGSGSRAFLGPEMSLRGWPADDPDSLRMGAEPGRRCPTGWTGSQALKLAVKVAPQVRGRTRGRDVRCFANSLRLRLGIAGPGY
jgi:hypothetical protein